MMLRALDEQCQSSAGLKFTLQAVITKADTIPVGKINTHIPKMKRDIFEAAPTCLPTIITSAGEHPFFGVEEVRKAITEACSV